VQVYGNGGMSSARRPVPIPARLGSGQRHAASRLPGAVPDHLGLHHLGLRPRPLGPPPGGRAPLFTQCRRSSSPCSGSSWGRSPDGSPSPEEEPSASPGSPYRDRMWLVGRVGLEPRPADYEKPGLTLRVH